jgi:hypothetical protein
MHKPPRRRKHNDYALVLNDSSKFQLFAIFAFRYHMYRKRGGKGTFWEALFGESKRSREKKAKKSEKAEWHNWPMLRYVPTYSTKDLAEENDKREREEKEKKSRSSSK